MSLKHRITLPGKGMTMKQWLPALGKRANAAALILFLAAFLAGTLEGTGAAPARPTGGAPKAPRSSTPTPTPTPPPADYGWAVCSTADVLSIVGKTGPLYNQTDGAVSMIQARIAACKRTINQYIAGLTPAGPPIAQNPPGLPPLPAPTPQTTTPPQCSTSVPGTKTPTKEPMVLYSALTFCTAWIAKNIPTPAGGTPTPQPIGFHTPFAGSLDPWNKAVYVMALASDPLLSAQIAMQLANNLRDPKMNPRAFASPGSPGAIYTRLKRDIYSNQIVKYVVVPAPAWGLDKYQQQCFNDPSTAGAIVAVQPSVENRTYNLFASASTTIVNMQLMVIDCEPTNTSYTNNAAYITWLSHVRSGGGTRVSINLATLLAAGAIYYGFQSQKTTTYTLGAPSPIPLGSTYQTAYTVTSRSANETSTAVGAASALGTSAAFGEVPSGDAQTAAAVKSLLPQLVDDLMYPCNMNFPEQTSLPQPQCFWFTYRPTATPKP